MSVVTLFPFPGGGGGAVSSGTFRIASGSVTSDLTDFPVRVDLARMPAGFWAGTNNGEDLRFFSGATELPTDLVYCDTVNEKGEIWVLVPLVDADADTDITWEIDGTSSRPAAGDANGMNAVWADYEYVGIPYSDYSDRTGNNSLASSTSVTYSAPSGGASQYAGGGQAEVDADKIVYSCADLAGVFTVSVSFYTELNNQYHIIGCNTSESGSTNRVHIDVQSGNNVGVWDNNNTWLTTGFDPDTTNWNRATTKYNGSTQRKIFCNATYSGTDNTVTSKSGYSTIWLGNSFGTGSGGLRGKIGWAYIRGEYLSDDWIVAEHNMMADITFCDAV